ncbi:MAG: glutathione-dependent formaldehyde dehydrogenase [Deltaproteobacteria bacterium]|nr:glutathione-dependent formaldehyde dehydrogenase [Deltaproteobacteria bacterium]
MRAVVFHGIGDIRLDEVPEPQIEEATDAIVRLTASAICGTDLHMVRGTLPGMEPGTILGHEGVGIVEELGDDVRNFDIGDRVVICSTIACGTCLFCRGGHYSQCDRANPHGPAAGTAFFGGPRLTGPFHGLQAELARIPFANVGMVKLPDEITDDQAILLSDIFPTGYFAADLADIHPGRTVAVFGCGPVGQFAIASAKLMDAGRILAIDCIDSRLEMARAQGAEVIDFEKEDPVEAILRLTTGMGVDCAIDAVGVDAVRRHDGAGGGERFARELQEIAPEQNPQGENWHPGDAPSQAVTWAVQALCKAGNLSIVGVYPQSATVFPLGLAMGKNLTIRMGNCDHRRYVPILVELVVSGQADPTRILTQLEPLSSAVEAYRAFDTRQPRWVKVELQPGM